MFGLEQFNNTFGSWTVALLIEVLVAIAGILIVYKKLKDKIIGNHEERKKQKEDIKKALIGTESINTLIDTCNKIQEGVNENQRILNERLDRLEDRERNDLREKILNMHRLFTNKKRNPMHAWSEMERDSFNELIKDYESLNGNGHIHTVVIPEMNALRVILMTDMEALAELFHSREV